MNLIKAIFDNNGIKEEIIILKFICNYHNHILAICQCGDKIITLHIDDLIIKKEGKSNDPS